MNENKGNTMELVAPYVLSSVERHAELQKKCLELAAGQFRDLIALNKKFASYFPVPPNPYLDFAERSFEKGVQTHRTLIDAALEHSQAVVRISTESQTDVEKFADQVKSVIAKSVEQVSAVQKDVAEFAIEETRKASENAAQQFGSAGVAAAPVVDAMKKNLNVMADLQKSVVDIATKPLKTGSAKA